MSADTASERPAWDSERAASELREQLASPRRRLGLFLGAGTSMALGFPGIDQLTRDVAASLAGDAAGHYRLFRDQGASNVEDVLSQVRLCRELIGESTIEPVEGLTGAAAATLDHEICEAIREHVIGDPPDGDEPARVLAHWLAQTHRRRAHPVEVFTTNYDLVLERAMEGAQVPYFDGFVGSVQPFFAPESVDPLVEAELIEVSPPRAWTRLWKLHGSIGWRLIGSGDDGRITRSGQPSGPGELMIFPSREKYAESRRLPFIALQDRLRRFLASGEVLILIQGYSFSDQHLNEILLQSLRANSRLAMVVLAHGERAKAGDALVTPETMLKHAEQHRNLAVLGPDVGCYGGVVRRWSAPTAGSSEPPGYWDTGHGQLALGDFTVFANWVEENLLGRPSDEAAPTSESAEATAGS